MPDFDWYGGHSDMVLISDQAQKLDTLWNTHIANLKKDMKKGPKDRDNDRIFIK